MKRRAMPEKLLRVFGVAVVVALATLLAGCGPRSLRQAGCLDPTDSCNWSVIIVRNDTPRSVALRGCLHHCGQGDSRLDPVVVASHGSSPYTQFGSVTALTGDLAWWEVRDYSSGKPMGCLTLDGHPDKADGDIVAVSQARPCDKHQHAAAPIGHATRTRDHPTSGRTGVILLVVILAAIGRWYWRRRKNR